MLVPWLYLGHFGPLKILKAGGRPPGGLLATSRSQLLRATWSPGNCARPSSWRQYPGSHLGRLHPASFVTRWPGTRGTVRDAPLHISSTRSVPRWGLPSRRLELGTHRSQGVGTRPRHTPAGTADPPGSPAAPETAPARAPLAPRARSAAPRHSPPPRPPPAPLGPARRRLPPPEAPRSRAPPPGARPRCALTTRGPAQRFLPLPRCHSAALAAELRTPKFILAAARSMPLLFSLVSLRRPAVIIAPPFIWANAS